ncbi:MAG: FAD-dependent oxidoreductase [Pseudomonadota bacterium]
MRVVIVGGGQAAVSAAATLRTEGHEGPITMLSAEPVAPYQRPPLSKKYLLGAMSLDRLMLKDPSYYGEAGIDLRLGTPARAIDRAAQRVEIDGDALAYDALVLATGAVPRRLPATMGGDLPGVVTIRDLADADRLAPAVAPGRRALVVGGGYIGLEAAAVAARRGMAVTLIEMAPRLLARVAAPETAAHFRTLHSDEGVDIREGTALAGIERQGEALAATLSDGTVLTVDLVIVGIGIEPAAALAEAAGLDTAGGIVVDGTCRTADPAILAAGDNAAFPWTMPDGSTARIRLESVQNAIDQGAHAARAIVGEVAPYAPVPWFWSEQYDTRLQIAGLNTGYDRVVAKPGARPGSLLVWYFAGERFIAADAAGDPRGYMQAKRWLEAGEGPVHDPLPG